MFRIMDVVLSVQFEEVSEMAGKFLSRTKATYNA